MDELTVAIESLLKASSWSAVSDVIHTHPVLLEENALQVLQQILAAPEIGEFLAAQVEQYIELLRQGEPVVNALAEHAGLHWYEANAQYGQSATEALKCFERFQHEGDVGLLDEVLQVWTSITQHQDFQSTPQGYQLYALDALGTAQISRYAALGQKEDLIVGLAALEQASERTPQGSKFSARRLLNLAGALAHKYELEGLEADLTRAVVCARQAVAETALEDPLLPGRINNLGATLAMQYRLTGNTADLEEALQVYDDAIASSSENLVVRARLLHGRGMSLRQQYHADDLLKTLEDSVASFAGAVRDVPPDSPEKLLYVGDLAMALGTRFEECGKRQDLDKAVALLEQTVADQTIPDTLLKSHLGALAICYRTRYDKFAQDEDLTKSCTTLHDVLALTDPGSSQEWSNALQNYGQCLEQRLALLQARLAESTSKGGTLRQLSEVQWDLYAISLDTGLRDSALENLRHAIAVQRGLEKRETQFALALRLRAIGDDDPSSEVLLTEAIELLADAAKTASGDEVDVYAGNLALMLIERYRRTGVPADLTDGLTVVERQLTEVDRIEVVANYLTAVDLLFEQGELDRLNCVIETGRQALQRFTDFSAPRCQVASGTAENLRRRYEMHGQSDDVTTAWTIGLQATDQGRLEDPLCAPIYNAMGWAARTRFETNSEIEFLEQAVSNYARAVALAGEDPVFLTNFGSSLRARHAIRGDDADLDQSILLLQRAADGPTGQHGHGLAVMSLANALLQRYSNSNNLDDLDDAISAYRAAADAADFRVSAGAIINLSRALLTRLAVGGGAQDLDEAIALLGTLALDALPPQTQATYALVLGNAFTARATLHGDAQDFTQAAASFRRAIDRGRQLDLEVAMAVAAAWMKSCFTRRAWSEAVEVAEHAVGLINQVLDISLNLANKTRWLNMIRDLPALCAYAFARQGQLQQAIVVIEGSRARVMSEALDLGRRDLEQLPALGHRRVYERFKSLAARLREGSLEFDGSIYRQHLAASAREQLEEQFANACAEIRAIPGFENLLQGDSTSDLTQATEHRPLIYLIDTPAGGLALVASRLTGQLEIQPIWLPELNEGRVHDVLGIADVNNAECYLGAFLNYRRAPAEHWDRWCSALDRVCQWMGEAVVAKLLSETPATFNPNGITLVPCGFLSLLPWHAAIVDEVDGVATFVTEKTHIAYAPNARAMVRDRSATAQQRLLLVANPQPVSSSPLPYVNYEITQAEKVWPPEDRLVRRETEATFDEVVEQLRHCSVFHFAGHAHADVVHPGQSGIQLANERVLTVDDFARMKIDLSLAILSGCETAVPGLKTVNELVSLPTALVQVGARSVIGSMWLVLDSSSALLIGEFHRYWRKEGVSPVAALHQAQQQLRDSGFDHPAYWAAFAFIGVE